MSEESELSLIDKFLGIPIVVNKTVPKGKVWLIGKPKKKGEKPEIVEIWVNDPIKMKVEKR